MKAFMAVACALPLTAAGFGMDDLNDQRHTTPGGLFGVYQCVHHRSDRPTTVTTWICSGAIGIHVPAINWEIKDPKKIGLQQLWALSFYTTNSLPPVWLPAKIPPTPRESREFLRFSSEKDGQSIPNFIKQYGLPSRYLVGQVSTFSRQGFAPPTVGALLQGPDFLIYDLPSGHTVALYVPKPPADKFVIATIIDSKGDLLLPNMMELQLPHRIDATPRAITAGSNGIVTAMGASGREDAIGAWTTQGDNLVVSTINENTEAFAWNETISHASVQYAPDILVNSHVVICGSISGREHISDNSTKKTKDQ